MIADFLKTQLDYIYFFYGAAFFLLIPICLFLRRRTYYKLPWMWLLWFGAFHGTNEWLDLVALNLETDTVFNFVRLGVLIISFLCLAEFGRAGTYTIFGRGPGRWILLAMVALASLGWLAGTAGFFAVTRYVFGLVGGIWAAAALFLSIGNEPSSSRRLLIGSVGMAVYALAAGLVVPPAPFVPASCLNYDSFFEFTGVPIQLIRGLLAIWISASLCSLALTSLEKDQHFRAWFRQLVLGVTGGLALLLIIGWAFTNYLGNIAARDKRDDYTHDAAMVSKSVMDKMEEADRVVRIISVSPVISSALAAHTIQHANSVLDICSQTLPESVCYLMDLQGLTIASSNRNSPDSFLGKSYAFRPYFQHAIQGSTGKYWALGVTSKELGYYTSFPIRNNAGEIIGAAVVKRVFVEMQAVIHNHDLGLIVDQSGIVVMANWPEMILKSLWPLTAAERNDLLASRQFGGGPFTPILTQRPVDKSECLFQGKRHLVVMQPIPETNCAVIILGSIWPIAQARLLGISVTLLFCLGLIGFLAIVVVMRESEEGFRQLFDNAADILILHDKGKIIRVNQKACHSLGYNSEELSAMSIFHIEVAYSKQFLINLWESGEDVINLSGIYRRKDGSTFPAEIRSGKITYRGQKLRLAAARDVTERKQAEEALLESEKRFRDVAESAHEWVWEVNAEGKYTYASPIVEKLLGYKPEEILDKYFYDLFIPEEREKLREIAWATFTKREPFREFINWNLHKDGSMVCLATSGVPILDKDGKLLGYRGADIDITKRKKAEEALAASKEELQKSKENYQTLAGQLLTAQETEWKRLARELHDDLTQRLAALAMETEGIEMQASTARGVGSVRMKAVKDKIVKLSIDAHALSRRLHPSILDDLGLADAIASEIAAFSKQNGIVVTYHSEGALKGADQEVRLCFYRILQESLRNISRHSKATKVNISLIGKDHTIHLTIKDDGKGFDPQKIKKKAGLGLASMRERALLVGGNFSLRSQPGKGTVIEVEAPLTRITL